MATYHPMMASRTKERKKKAMLYYKANTDAYDYFTKNALIKNELLTAKERNSKFRYLSDSYFAIIELPKSKVFWNFGVRLEKR